MERINGMSQTDKDIENSRLELIAQLREATAKTPEEAAQIVRDAKV